MARWKIITGTAKEVEETLNEYETNAESSTSDIVVASMSATDNTTTVLIKVLKYGK